MMTTASPMICMDIKVKVSPKHHREFMQVALGIIKDGNKEKGCLGYHFHRDMEQDNVFNFETKWKSADQLDGHISSQNFGTLLGALNFLGDSHEVVISKVTYVGGNQHVSEIRKHVF